MTPKRRRDEAVPRPLKRAEYEIRFITRQAEVGWRDALATSRSGIVDAWDRLTMNPKQEDGHAVYRLKGDLATGQYEGSTFSRLQYKFSSGGRIWYFVDERPEPASKVVGRVLIERCDSAHPKETE